jgi:hypothetical protein
MEHNKITFTSALIAATAWLLIGCGAEVDTPSQSSGAAGDGDRDDDFATARPLALSEIFEGKLSPTGDVDFFVFEGKAFQILEILTGAETLDDVSFDDRYIDTRITLFDADHNPIAENDDRIPEATADSDLVTRLPRDGTYFIRVADCWSVAEDPEASCRPSKVKTDVDYKILMEELDAAFTYTTFDGEKGDDPTTFDNLFYPDPEDAIVHGQVFGTFASAADIDVFAFNLPPTVKGDPGERAGASFWVFPGGKLGTGSTTDVGRAYITDAADPMTVLAEIAPDPSGTVRLAPPVEVNKSYLLFLTRHPDRGGSNDFYVARHVGSALNPVEAKEAENDSLATAEPLFTDEGGSSSPSFYIEGDLPAAGPDIDHFKAAVPVGLAGKGKVSVICSAHRVGSGLRGLTISLFDGNGSPIPHDPDRAKETIAKDAIADDVPIPAGVTDVVLKLQASYEPSVSGVFYRCGLHLHL